MVDAFGEGLLKAITAEALDASGQRDSLIRAAGRGHIDTVKALLEAGADLNAKDKEGKTALMYAKEKNHTEIVHLLKKAGAKE